MTLLIRLPIRAADYLAGIIALSVFIGIVGLGAGVSIGHRLGTRQTTRALAPAIDANAAEIAVLYERIIYLEEWATITGLGSWYGVDGEHGKQTANRETFDKNALTIAVVWPLPLNRNYRVTNTENGKSGVFWANDRIPYVHRRIVDLSEASAKAVGMIERGVAPVTLGPGL